MTTVAPELRGAYRRWLMQAHPDRGGDPAAFVQGLAEWQRRQRLVRLLDLQDDGAAGLLPPVADTGVTVETRHRVQAVRDALARLPFELRAPLVLRELEGCSYAEVAHVLRLPEATVRGRLARGRRELVGQMQEWA